MEETRKSKTWLVFVVILVLCVGMAVFVPSMLSKSKDTKKEEGTVEKDTNEISGEVKTKLERWVNIASNYDSVDTGTSTMQKFAKGVTKLDANTKLVMTYNAVMREKKIFEQDTYELTKEDVNRMESAIGKDQILNEPVHVMKISDFNNTYKDLFDEEASYTLEDIGFGCPTPWGMDKSADSIYLFSRCGGTSPLYDESRIESISNGEDGYQVSQEIDIINGAEQDKVEETYRITWSFDKNLKFVKSEGQKV